MEFIEYNANPKHLKTGDCVIRAISFALNKDYIETYRELFEIGIEKCNLINHKKVFEQYLNNLKISKKRINGRLTVETFINNVAEVNKTYIIDLGKHLTVVIDKVLYDIWNCCNKNIESYFELDTIVPVNQRHLLEWKKDNIETIKNKYVAGTKIRLIKMYDKQTVPKWNSWCC